MPPPSVPRNTPTFNGSYAAPLTQFDVNPNTNVPYRNPGPTQSPYRWGYNANPTKPSPPPSYDFRPYDPRRVVPKIPNKNPLGFLPQRAPSLRGGFLGSFAGSLVAQLVLEGAQRLNNNTPTALEEFMRRYPNQAPPQYLIDNHNLIREEQPTNFHDFNDNNYPSGPSFVFPLSYGRYTFTGGFAEVNVYNFYNGAFLGKVDFHQEQPEFVVEGQIYAIYCRQLNEMVGGRTYITVTVQISPNPDIFNTFRLIGNANFGDTKQISFKYKLRRTDIPSQSLLTGPPGEGSPHIPNRNIPPTIIIESFKGFPAPNSALPKNNAPPDPLPTDRNSPNVNPNPYLNDNGTLNDQKGTYNRLRDNENLQGALDEMKETLDRILENSDEQAGENALRNDILRAANQDNQDQVQNSLLDQFAKDVIRDIENTSPSTRTNNEPSPTFTGRNFTSPSPTNATTTSPANPHLNPLTNLPRNPAISPADIPPTISTQPAIPTQTQTQTNIETDKILEAIKKLEPANQSKAENCKDSTDPLAKCLSNIEDKLDKNSQEARDKQPETTAIQGIVTNVKCNKFGELDQSEGSFSYEGSNFRGISSQLSALTKLIVEIKKDVCRLEAVAGVPEHWDIRPSGEIPQLVIQWAEKKSSGAWENPRYTTVIPHYNGTRNPVLPTSWTKGKYQGVYQLKDGSSIVLYASSIQEAERILKELSKFTKSAMRIIPDNFKIGKVTSNKFKTMRVYPVTARYFDKGRKATSFPTWTKYFRP